LKNQFHNKNKKINKTINHKHEHEHEHNQRKRKTWSITKARIDSAYKKIEFETKMSGLPEKKNEKVESIHNFGIGEWKLRMFV